MKGMRRIIVHTDNVIESEAFLRIAGILPEYWRLKPPNDGRCLTIRFDDDGTMAIYHDIKDLVIFGSPSKE